MNRRQSGKKPVSKATAELIKQLARKHGVRDPAKRFLIVCEDQKSAVNYFKSLKSHFKLTASSVEVVGSGGRTQPQQVVDRAKALKDASSQSSGTEPFDQVWCVIDGDFGNKITNARESAKAHGIELAISTKCFEYWVLLHFIESDQPALKCNKVVSQLDKSGLPGYEKGKCDFKDVVANVNIASKRAKKLRKPGINRGELPENQNPCSEVYKLIEALGIIA